MALEQFKLDDQVAIVTSAERGVGEGIAKVLKEAGATVVGASRTPEEINHTITEIEKFGRVDFLVNNVGGANHALFLDITDEDFSTPSIGASPPPTS